MAGPPSTARTWWKRPWPRGINTIQDFKLPIFHFLQRFCGIYPYLDLTDVRPAAADAALAEIFQVPMGTPLLNMEEVDYDIDGRPVFLLQRVFCGRHLPPTPSCGKNSEAAERSACE